MTVVLAIDPGKRTGWCIFVVTAPVTTRGGKKVIEIYEAGRGVSNEDDDLDLFESLRGDSSHVVMYQGWDIDEIVVEDYVIDPKVKQGGQRVIASEVIGAFMFAARKAGIPFTRQRADRLPVAMLHTGYVPPKTRTGNKKHLPDEDSAYLHGYYYLEQKGILKPKPLD